MNRKVMLCMMSMISVVMEWSLAGDQDEAARSINRLQDPASVAVFADAPSKVTVRAGQDPAGACLEVDYTLDRVHDWGSWLSLVLMENKQTPLNLSDGTLVVMIKVTKAAPVPTTLRVSIYDVDDQGQYEWYYAEDKAVLMAVTAGWCKLQFPLGKFQRAPANWNGPVNDGVFDPKRIGKIELSMVTSSRVSSKGAFLMKDLAAGPPAAKP